MHELTDETHTPACHSDHYLHDLANNDPCVNSASQRLRQGRQERQGPSFRKTSIMQAARLGKCK